MLPWQYKLCRHRHKELPVKSLGTRLRSSTAYVFFKDNNYSQKQKKLNTQNFHDINFMTHTSMVYVPLHNVTNCLRYNLTHFNGMVDCPNPPILQSSQEFLLFFHQLLIVSCQRVQFLLGGSTHWSRWSCLRRLLHKKTWKRSHLGGGGNLDNIGLGMKVRIWERD